MTIKRTGSLDQALNRLLVSDKLHVKVGILENSKYPDGTSVPTVAYKNEYGWANIPPRPFFRDTIKQNKSAWSELAKRGIAAGYSMDKILGLVGTSMQNDIQMSITQWRTPPNSAYTVAIKGFNKPLIHTSLLRDSIKYEIIEGKL